MDVFSDTWCKLRYQQLAGLFELETQKNVVSHPHTVVSAEIDTHHAQIMVAFCMWNVSFLWVNRAGCEVKLPECVAQTELAVCLCEQANSMWTMCTLPYLGTNHMLSIIRKWSHIAWWFSSEPSATCFHVNESSFNVNTPFPTPP